MHPDRRALLDAWTTAPLQQPGALDLAIRAAAAAAGVAGIKPLPAEAQALVAKIHHHAWRIADADIAALRAAGWSDERVFELVIASAVGAGAQRLNAGLQALAAARSTRPVIADPAPVTSDPPPVNSDTVPASSEPVPATPNR